MHAAADNYIETVHGGLEMETNPPYLMYTHGNDEVRTPRRVTARAAQQRPAAAAWAVGACAAPQRRKCATQRPAGGLACSAQH